MKESISAEKKREEEEEEDRRRWWWERRTWRLNKEGEKSPCKGKIEHFQVIILT